MLSYIKKSVQRKIARRITKKYSTDIVQFHLPEEGLIEFAKWKNPLARTIDIHQSHVNFYKKFVKHGDLVIDIGANIGDTTVPIALAANHTGLTLAFDPNPHVFEILKENAALNQDKSNIVPFRNAISVEEEEFYYISSEASFANGDISKEKGGKHGKFTHREKVKGINLFKFLKEKFPKWLDKLSLIKIDTEGYDKEILKSISDLIIQYKPSIIAECFGGNTPEEKMELFEVLDQMNYNIYYFSDFEEDTSEIKLNHPREVTQWAGTVDIYARPK
jgi:FkbM family methyltransferase